MVAHLLMAAVGLDRVAYGNLASLVSRGAIREGEIRRFEGPTALGHQRQVVLTYGPASRQHALQETADDRPDIRPGLARRPTEIRRVFGANDDPRCVVVDLEEVRIPPHEARDR